MATRLLITGIPALALAAAVACPAFAGPAPASPVRTAEEARAARAEARLAVRAALELQATPPDLPPELPGLERTAPPRPPGPRPDDRGRSKGRGETLREGLRESGELESNHAEDDARAAHLDAAERAANGEAISALHSATANSHAAAAQLRTNSARQGRGARGHGQALDAASGPGP